MKRLLISLVAVASLFLGASAVAQETSECDGVISIVRISNYVDTGT